MSKQIGLIKLKGNMGGISFFQSEGKHLAKISNGPDKDKIANDPRFERTRENNSEFGGSATASKALRRAFAPVIHMADARFSSRLTGIFKEINSKGDGIRGKRPITLSEHHVQLVNMEFNINRSFTSLFTATFAATNAAQRTSTSINIDDVLMRKSAKGPEGSTHVMFTQALGVVSDYVYDENLKRYAPVEPSLDGLSVITESEYIPVDGNAPVSVTLNSALPGNPVLNENVSVIQCIGIEFFQQLKTAYYPLLQGSALKIVKVF
ncbi:hypothetical protein [Chryseosolibacter indicus]|uniref:Uncharacterized protein n=1 Tax=Chryseosolibacter indicus TaxID=2782351 RepID=A0ABS5VQT3_9BACT|nr:hypothetical protein [Chryseosolibacter indicus]MBT1703812.1 hypothetical protein [Chryseosolibacter indicus]